MMTVMLMIPMSMGEVTWHCYARFCPHLKIVTPMGRWHQSLTPLYQKRPLKLITIQASKRLTSCKLFEQGEVVQCRRLQWSGDTVTKPRSDGLYRFTVQGFTVSQLHSANNLKSSTVHSSPQFTAIWNKLPFCALIYNLIALLGKALKDAMSVGRIWRDMRKPMMFFFLPEDQL